MEGDTPQEKPLPLTEKDKEFIVGMRREMHRINKVGKQLAKELGMPEGNGPRLLQLMFSEPELIREVEGDEQQNQ